MLLCSPLRRLFAVALTVGLSISIASIPSQLRAAPLGTGSDRPAASKPPSDSRVPVVSLYVAKALNYNGSGADSGIIVAVEWCVGQGVKVINMSLGIPGSSDGRDALSTAVNNAVDAGGGVVVAAGNSGDGPKTIGSPGAAEKAITVVDGSGGTSTDVFVVTAKKAKGGGGGGGGPPTARGNGKQSAASN